MPFKKGQSGNPTGRPKGATNKTPAEIREIFSAFLSKNLLKMQKDFDLLEPKERLHFIIQVGKIVLPRYFPESFSEPLFTEEEAKKMLYEIKNADK